MKKMFTLILAATLCLSMAACGSEPDDTSEPDSESSSSSQDVGEEESEDASLEVVEGEGDEPEEDENVSKLDTEEPASEPEASQEAESSSQASAPASSAGGQSGGQSTSSQAPASQPEEQPEEEAEQEGEPVSQEPTQPVTQPSSQSQAPAASSQDDPTAWTQEKVDNLVAKYREVALDRGWEEAPELNINGNGAWGNPIDTSWADYNNEMKTSNIEEYLYMLEYDIDRTPEEMSFNLYVEDEGNHWVIYFIFAGDMK